MLCRKIQLENKEAEGYVIPLGPLNIVCITTDTGMIACGAFDIAVFDKYGYPAVRIKSASGTPLNDIEDLLLNPVKDANISAVNRGIREGMSGKEALALL